MKNYNEMAENLFERRDEYNRVRKAKMKKVKIGVSTLSCFCLAVLLGVGVMYKDAPKNLPETTNTVQAAQENVVKINKVGSIDTYRANHEISTPDTTKLSAEEIDNTMKTQLGITPNIPKDLNALSKEGEAVIGLYVVKENGEVSDISFSTVFNYANDDSSRNVKLEVFKGEVYADVAKWDNDDDFAKSEIKNTDVYIASDSEGQYFAKLGNEDTNYRLITEGITEQELISIIESLID